MVERVRSKAIAAVILQLEGSRDSMLAINYLEVSMRVLPPRLCAQRMAILLCVVVALDVVAVFFTARPRLWCAIIPALIPLFTPAAIFSFRRVPSKN